MKTTLALLTAVALLFTACGTDDADSGEGLEAVGSDTGDGESEGGESEGGESDDGAADSDGPDDAEMEDVEADASNADDGGASDTESDQSASASAGGFTLRGFRYCEILLTVTGDDGSQVTEVWGTPGVDPCSDEDWYALDAEAIKAANDATFIEMNGPRYFVVDGTVDVGDGTGTGVASGGETVLREFGDLDDGPVGHHRSRRGKPCLRA
jgi:hypothetical protein